LGLYKQVPIFQKSIITSRFSLKNFLKNILYQLGRGVINLYAILMLHIDIRQMDQLPEGPVIIAANHPSATDPFLIHLVLRKPVSVCITHTAFSVPILGPFMRMVNQISVIPGYGEKTLARAVQMLSMGRAVAIFPEGLISPIEGGFHQPHSGVARLAISTGVPVIPVGISLNKDLSTSITSGISGSETTAWWYLHGPYVVTVGEPLKFEGASDDRQKVQSVSRQIMDSIQELVNESESRRLKKNKGLYAG
jgi:1-acyl-sn-glycerol-3-phosphate acyltransferase